MPELILIHIQFSTAIHSLELNSSRRQHFEMLLDSCGFYLESKWHSFISLLQLPIYYRLTRDALINPPKFSTNLLTLLSIRWRYSSAIDRSMEYFVSLGASGPIIFPPKGIAKQRKVWCERTMPC